MDASNLLRQILQMPGVQEVTPVRIREPDGTIREDCWPMNGETVKKFADTLKVSFTSCPSSETKADEVLTPHEGRVGEEAILAIVMNARPSQEAARKAKANERVTEAMITASHPKKAQPVGTANAGSVTPRALE